MDALFEGLVTFVHQGWASDQLANRDLNDALTYYGQAEPIIANWGRIDVASECLLRYPSFTMKAGMIR